MMIRLRFCFLLIFLFSYIHISEAQRVIGGEVAQDGAYPWMAALIDSDDTRERQESGVNKQYRFIVSTSLSIPSVRALSDSDLC